MVVNVFPQGDCGLLRFRYAGFNTRPNDVNVGPISRQSWIIHYIMKGRGYFNGAPVSAGQGFLITPGHTEEYHSDKSDPWELVWFVSDDGRMEKLFEYFDADAKTGVFPYFKLSSVETFIQKVLLKNEKFPASSEFLALFLDIFAYHEKSAVNSSPGPAAESYVHYACDYLQSNFRTTVTVESLTELLGISQPYLYRIFTSAMGCSPREYLSRLRILEAKKLLTETNFSVSQISLSCGYPDALTFSRFFSRKAGMSPSAYRNSKNKNL